MQMITMKKLSYLLTITACMLGGAAVAQKKSKGWISLFDGKTLNGWKVGDNAASFTVDSGMIIAHGNVAHLFYDGKVGDHNFKNFHFKAQVKTTPGSNSGLYFHTTFQQGGWPSKGYEVQVNNSHTDWRRTGSLYAVQDVKEVYVKDNEWYTEEIIVEGNKITTKVNGKVLVEYTEPENVQRSPDMNSRKLSGGTFALQAHDPNSKVYYKDIQVKILP